VEADDPGVDVWVYPQGFDGDRNIAVAPRTLIGDGANNAPVKPGKRRMTWDARADDEKLNSSNFTISMQVFSGASLYMVVDLSGGPTAVTYPVRYSSTPPDLNDDACRTTNLWLRLILPGTFKMGSPSSELGRLNNSGYETLHEVTLTQPFYMGIFEVTQKQWELITGENLSSSSYRGDTRPVGSLRYDMIRGNANGAEWPRNNQVDTTSFMGLLRAKTSMTFDLPTEAQWEYACRAGTSTALNNGKDLTAQNQCPNMDEVGRYNNNQTDNKGGYNSGSTKVGSYRPNAWGLYDMHGNAAEYCLDVFDGYGTVAVIDPKGPISAYSSPDYRIKRGGGFESNASSTRSASRSYYVNGWIYSHDGFRACVLPSPVP